MEDEEPRPGNFDRAWNDPPLFSYKSTSQGPNKLNKRVNHPVPSGTETGSYNKILFWNFANILC
jgi:hypothetical protein